ncbi:MAG TPA: nucleotide sugar dehydrogenase [Candidatus Angelobacter sp.]
MGKSISIFGLGYVGSVTAACLVAKGNRIVGVDSYQSKVDMLDSGQSPILEPQLQELITQGKQAGLLSATTDVERAIAETDITFISVGTPSLRNGKLDLRAIERVCEQIAHALARKNSFHWIIMRSTVLPGTTSSLVVPILEMGSGKVAGKDFAVCFNPEFLREGTAVDDFFNPTMTILGSDHAGTLDAIRELYSWVPGKLFVTTSSNAEMVKYVCNAYHALKVAFANEIGTMCVEVGVDPQKVTEMFTADDKLNISKAYLKPGFAFGGSCLPKDLRALTYKAKELDLRIPLLDSILPSNVEHIERAVEQILATEKRKVGVLGLSFKPGTDDLRESPMVHLVKRLIGEGCQIRIWDPNVALGQLIGSNRQFIQEAIPHIGSFLRDDVAEVVDHAEVLIVASKEIPAEAQAVIPDDLVIINVATLEGPRQKQLAHAVSGR